MHQKFKNKENIFETLNNIVNKVCRHKEGLSYIKERLELLLAHHSCNFFISSILKSVRSFKMFLISFGVNLHAVNGPS